MVELETLYCSDVTAWAEWLAANHDSSPGIRLAIAKKGGDHPSVSYAEALDEALCHGWIDGQKGSLDEHHFLQNFGPRRPQSLWSKINVDKAEALVAAGRMKAAGLAEIERAKANGRWATAYAGSKTIEVPHDLTAALATNPAAAAFFEKLSATNRYAILFRINNVKRADTRARKIAEYVLMLSRHETIYPQKSAE
ncbi:MAG: hypothetical protein JWQ19_965 [Subtercola sp.]|nr:hypothetical protein [Subtercola sp.]